MRLFWFAILAGLGLGGWYLYDRSTRTPGSLKCPDISSTEFKASLERIRSGETSSTTAETMAQGWQNGGCIVAADAIRAAIPATGTPVDAPGTKTIGGGTAKNVGGLGSGVVKKPSVGTGVVDYVLKQKDVDEGISLFAQTDSGFGSVEAFLSANSGLGPVESNSWPPETTFRFQPADLSEAEKTYEPTGRIEMGSHLPSYKQLETGAEVVFPYWSAARSTTGYTGERWRRAGTTGGERYSMTQAVTFWAAGDHVNVKSIANVVRTSGVRTSGSLSLGSTECMSGAKAGWNDAYLGKPMMESTVYGPFWFAGYVRAYQLARFGPYPWGSLPSSIPIKAMSIVLSACATSIGANPSGTFVPSGSAGDLVQAIQRRGSGIVLERRIAA